MRGPTYSITRRTLMMSSAIAPSNLRLLLWRQQWLALPLRRLNQLAERIAVGMHLQHGSKLWSQDVILLHNLLSHRAKGLRRSQEPVLVGEVVNQQVALLVLGIIIIRHLELRPIQQARGYLGYLPRIFM